MNELKPKQAAMLADDVYALTRLKSIEYALKFLNAKYKGSLCFAENNMLKGKSGGPGFIKCRTAFGFVLVGKKILAGHAFFIFRGTQYNADWLSNFNVGVSRSSYYRSAHDGFNASFKSMKQRLEPFLNSLADSDVHTVHCVGHSLGGALATLCAEWVEKTSSFKPKLYTFGSPRVGLPDFATCCTSVLRSENMFRVYHKTDVVPMIPTWPFTHVPTRGASYYLPSPGLYPGAEYHDMELYIKSVKGQTWPKLAGLRERVRTDKEVEDWLMQQGIITQSMESISWLDRAIAYVITKCLTGIGGIFMGGAATIFTILDRLAYILKKGIDISKKVSKYVLLLIKKIMSFLGYKREVQAAELTVSFIRNIFMRLHETVMKYANQALSQLLVKGRAI